MADISPQRGPEQLQSVQDGIKKLTLGVANVSHVLPLHVNPNGHLQRPFLSKKVPAGHAGPLHLHAAHGGSKVCIVPEIVLCVCACRQGGRMGQGGGRRGGA